MERKDLMGVNIFFFFFFLKKQNFFCTSGRRKSVAPQDLNKGNKRLSSVVKPFDAQTKKGKVHF